MMGRMKEIVIRDGHIRLGQFLKLADAIEQGSDAKLLLSEGRVKVNGELTDQRGRQLSRGDVVTVDEQDFRVT